MIVLRLTEEQCVWLRWALDSALREAQTQLPYAQAQAEAPKAAPKWKRNLAALRERIAAFERLTEMLKGYPGVAGGA